MGPLGFLLQKILTNEGNPRKREVAVIDGETYPLEIALSILQIIHESLTNLSPKRKKAADYFLLLQTLMKMFEKSVEHYNRKKYSMSALDFDDLQIKTMHLLRENETVRGALTSRFKHIMVDEFQDTNFLQYDIFLNLIDSFAGNARLFVVGDPKQSIYRFRNAQVEVSAQTEKEISGLKNGTMVSLLESFRMNADLASFVNEIFSRAMPGDRSLDITGLPLPKQTEYKPLIARRPKGMEPAVEIFLAGGNNNAEPPVDELSAGSPPEFSSSEQQALFVASRIRRMIDGNEAVRDVRLGEETRKIKYGDIAILLRSRSRPQ